MSKQEQMYRLVSEYRESDQSAKDFCAAKQIKRSTFQYWVHKEKRSRETAFVRVKTGVGYNSEGIELVYPNGVRVHFKHFDLELIGRLIHLG